jgi:hypothetical protein
MRSRADHQHDRDRQQLGAFGTRNDVVEEQAHCEGRNQAKARSHQRQQHEREHVRPGAARRELEQPPSARLRRRRGVKGKAERLEVVRRLVVEHEAAAIGVVANVVRPATQERHRPLVRGGPRQQRPVIARPPPAAKRDPARAQRRIAQDGRERVALRPTASDRPCRDHDAEGGADEGAARQQAVLR